MSRVLFLSHAGIDTEAAKALKARILAAPEAKENGLSVWFDKDDLDAGKPWQSQIEEAIEGSHAFAVYVGSKGVVNWVDAEVRLALGRAVTEPDYRFIPVLAGGAPGPEALPGFARQFQGVANVESRPDQFDALMRAILDGAEAGRLQLEAEPFFGLRAIEQSRSHLFFGREAETEALIALVNRTPLVMVTGDSGSGKSSLVRAGLIPRFHGGALAVLNGSRPEDAVWHTLTTRPRTQPFRELGDAVYKAAKGLGLALADRGTLADWAASGEPHKVRRALRCDLPAERVRVLLVVDQFEELLTITPPGLRAPFIDLLLDLADPADTRFRVVLTMRHDYVNLCSAFDQLKERLDANDRGARFQLGRVSDEGLRRIVTEPLRLAGVDAADREALAVQVLRDVGERPGDLALVQMALSETWQARQQYGNDLLRAYAIVGGVEGALANAAERVRTQVLDANQQTLLDSILLRLVRLGDTGGATRRVAARPEFDDARWELVQKLASEDGKRLVLLGGSPEQPTVEIAHEALVTAWPHFQNLLQANANDKRVFDAVIPRAQAWAASTSQASQEESEKRLATGADLELFAGLLGRRAEWLSGEERRFIEASKAAETRRRWRERGITRALKNALKTARANESRALAALSEIAANQHRYVDSVKLALAAWPRAGEEDRPKLRATIKALGKATRSQRQMIPPLRHEGSVNGAVFSGDAHRILSWSSDNTARVWDAATGQELLTLHHESAVNGALFSKNGRRILAWCGDWFSTTGTTRVWDVATGEALLTLRHEDEVYGAVFSGDGRRILSWSRDYTVRLWDAASGEELLTLRHPGKQFDNVSGAVFSGDERRILSWSRDGAVRLWETATGKELLTLRHEGPLQGAVFSGDAHRILSRSGNTAHVWDAATGEELLTLRHENSVYGALFSGDARRILSWSRDGTARVWDAATGEALLTFRHETSVRGVVFSSNERRILSWSGNNACVWDAATGEALMTLRHEGRVNGAVFSRVERRILSWSTDGTARVWDAATGQELLTLRHEGEVDGAAFSGDERRILSWSADGFWPRGRSARVWDAATGQELLTLRHERDVDGAVFSGDERRILSWSWDGTARVWDAASGEELLTFRHESAVVGALFSGDEQRILSWSSDGTACVWNAVTGRELQILRHQSAVYGTVFSGDERRILSWSDDCTARVWDAATGENLLTLYHEDRVHGAAFSGDGSRILSWSKDCTARLWDATTGEALLTLRHDVRGALFSGDERRILSWSWDGTARVWDTASGEALVILRHEKDVRGALFSGDERRILSWSGDGTVRLWDISRLPEGHLIDVACGLLPDHDTSGLKDRYGIAITTPICGPGTPAPVATELQD